MGKDVCGLFWILAVLPDDDLCSQGKELRVDKSGNRVVRVWAEWWTLSGLIGLETLRLWHVGGCIDGTNKEGANRAHEE